MSEMPALFIGHGSPMNAMERNPFTQAWRSFGQQLPKPRALLVVSAHWCFDATAVTAMPKPRTIHDFHGFPAELSEFQHPAPGDPELAKEVAEAVKPTWCGLDYDQWGLDHGTWSVLAHIYPEADVPVLQLSINALEPLRYHLELGSRLTSLRKQGIMVLASGNSVHNLRRVQWNRPDAAFDWAERFDDAVAQKLLDAPDQVLQLMEHPDYAAAVPTPDHFIPLLYIAGMTAGQPGVLQNLLRGYSMGSISMSCYGLGTESLACAEVKGAAGLPSGLPADQTNI